MNPTKPAVIKAEMVQRQRESVKVSEVDRPEFVIDRGRWKRVICSDTGCFATVLVFAGLDGDFDPP